MQGWSARPRTRAVAMASAVAVVVAGLGIVSASGNDAVPSAAAAPAGTGGTDTSARSSASLQRSLAAQSRLFSATAPAAETRATTASRSSSRTSAPAKPKPTFVGPIVWQGMPALEPGARHAAVKRLQKRLGIKVTGFYGPMTLAKVKAFQEWRGLPAKGYVGALTWQALYTPAPKARTTSSSRSRSSAPAPSAPVTSGRVCPAPGSQFGSGWGAQRAGHLHQGVDLMGPRGMPILAIESGTIIRAGRQSNGAIRIVQQGISGSKFYYGHMDSITVGSGSRVKRGQVIGYMGDTGSPGAVHLHFEYWKSGGESAAVDPYPLLKSLCW